MLDMNWSLASPSPVSQCDYTEWRGTRVIIPAIYLLAFISGTFGNALVLWVFLRCRVRRDWRTGYRHNFQTPHCPSSSSSHSVTGSLIASLAIADLAFVTTLPLWAAYTALDYDWPFGSLLCQLSSYLVALNMYASVFSLAGLSVERYYKIKCHSTIRNRTPLRARCIVGGVWVVASVLALPALLLRTVREVEADFNWMDEDEHGNKSGTQCLCDMDYSVLVSSDLDSTSQERAELMWAVLFGLKSTILGFLLPLVVLLICYCSVAHFLSHHFSLGPRPDRQRQRKLLRIVVALILTFFLCWLPFHTNKTLSALVELNLLPFSCSFDRWLVAAHPYAICLAYINSCLNPLLYACCDPAFRRHCKRVVTLVWNRHEDGKEKETKNEEEECARVTNTKHCKDLSRKERLETEGRRFYTIPLTSGTRF